MNSDEDTLFNNFFIRDKEGRVSFIVLSDKLGLDEESLTLFLKDKGEISNKSGRKYLMGWKYRDDARTPAQTSKQKLATIDEITDERGKIKKEELETYRLNQELEEYKRRLKIKNREIDEYKSVIKKHAREKLEMEESHRSRVEELTEKISLGHSLNERMQNILDVTKRDLERLSGMSVKILILTDFHEPNDFKDDKLISHTRSVFIPKDQNYRFEIGDPDSVEHKIHHNPDLKNHFM